MGSYKHGKILPEKNSCHPSGEVISGKFYDNVKKPATSGIINITSDVIEEHSTIAKIHGNDLRNPRPTHIYKIMNGEGEVVKIGESASGVNKYGFSKRAETQVRKLNQLDTDNVRYKSKIVREYPNKSEARKFETMLIEKRKSTNANSLPLNKTNR